MGEWSKKLGERGEHITESLLNLIGCWLCAPGASRSQIISTLRLEDGVTNC